MAFRAADQVTRGQVTRIGGDRAALPVILFPIARLALLNTAAFSALLLRLPPWPERKPILVPARVRSRQIAPAPRRLPEN